MSYLSFRMTLLALLLLFSAGCERSEPLGKVFGKVTLQGRPVTQGLVIFSNPEKGVYMTADLGPDGSYELQTARGFGLPLGAYKIAVNPPLPKMITGEKRSEIAQSPDQEIPARYRKPETSGLTIEVQLGDNPKDIDLT